MNILGLALVGVQRLVSNWNYLIDYVRRIGEKLGGEQFFGRILEKLGGQQMLGVLKIQKTC